MLTSNRTPIDLSEAAFGELRDSSDSVDDIGVLKQRMAEEGYLLLRGLLDPVQVMDTRKVVVKQLSSEGLLDPGYPPMEAKAHERARKYMINEALGKRPEIRKLLRAGRMAEFYTAFLGDRVRSFDYVWVRAVGPGKSERPHCDIVYMGRATHNLYTSWVPIGDVPKTDGALMILEQSHQLLELKESYWQLDVDRIGFFDNLRIKHGRPMLGGGYSKNPAKVQREFGRRWLTTDFRAGDVLVFSPFMLHCTLDNVSDRIRLSADVRYQLYSEPADDRWIGPNPIAHSRRQFGLLTVWNYGKQYGRWLDRQLTKLASLLRPN